jgi:hypothetical protein
MDNGWFRENNSRTSKETGSWYAEVISVKPCVNFIYSAFFYGTAISNIKRFRFKTWCHAEIVYIGNI